MFDEHKGMSRAASWVSGARLQKGRGAPLRGREAPEPNRLGVQGRAQAPLAPPEAKIFKYWMLLWLKKYLELNPLTAGAFFNAIL